MFNLIKNTAILIYFALSVYSSTILINLFQPNYQVVILCLSFLFFSIVMSVDYQSFFSVLRSSYSLILFSLLFSFLATGSLTPLRELIISLPVLCFLKSKINLPYSLKFLAKINFFLIIIGIIVFILIWTGFLNLSPWRVSDLSLLFQKDTPLYTKDILFFEYRCMYSPLFLYIVEVIRSACHILPNSGFRFYFYFIEPVASLMLISFICYLYSINHIKKLATAVLLSIIVFAITPNTTIILPLSIIFSVFFLSIFNKLELKRLIRYFLLAIIIFGSVLLGYQLIYLFIKQKVESLTMISDIVSNFVSTLSLFGIPSDTYEQFDGYGASFVILRYGLVGGLAWIAIYIPILLKSFQLMVGKNFNIRTKVSGCALLLMFTLALRYNTLLNPMLLLMSKVLDMSVINNSVLPRYYNLINKSTSI